MSETKEKTGWFARLKQGLRKTQVNLVGIFTGGVVDEAFLEDLEFQMISADIGVETSALILERLRERIKLKGLKTQDEVKVALKEIIADILRPCEASLNFDEHKPLVIMMCGVNGAGKTTTIGKLAKHFAQLNKKVLLAAADTFRAAAKEQLAVVMVDTAGRLPTQTNLMNELARIRKVQGKAMEGAPHEVILVLDGTNGQNALMQAKAFDEAAGLTGLIITKLDGTAKGGVLVALANSREKPLPIYYIGVGETIDDLQPFKADEFAAALVGLDQIGGKKE